MPPSLTTHLLHTLPSQLHRTTHPPFLAHASHGTLPTPLITTWLTSDKSYITGYITLATHLQSLVRRTTPRALLNDAQSAEARLLTWLTDAVKNVEREREWFDSVMARYALRTPASPLLGAGEEEGGGSKGVKRFDALFSHLAGLQQQQRRVLPWLEAAVCLAASERVYYEAFSWASEGSRGSASEGAYEKDADGGVMRSELIPNWSNAEFGAFVQRLERIVDEGVARAVEEGGEWDAIRRRAEGVWGMVLDAEEAFWPDVGGLT